MKAPEHFEVFESYCCYRLSGHGRLAEAASKVIEVITFSREQRMRNLLAFAEAARSALKLAMVVRPEMMDPEKFEVTVGKNRGLAGNVFDSEKDALAWLRDPSVR